MVAASVSSSGRPELKVQANRKATTAEADREANLRASYDEVALASAHDDITTSGDVPLVAPAVSATKSGTQEQAAEFTGPPIKIHVSEIETHLPFALQNALPDRPHELAKPEAAIESRAVEAPEQQRAPVKILKFEMEPATLGSISVRMRVTHARVDIQITAENASTSVLLADTRDALGSAIGEKGFSLHSYEVVNSPSTSASPQNGQSQSNFNEQQRAYAGERGFTGDDRSDQRQRQAPNGDPRHRDETSAGAPSVDLVL
jgi:chemotaxis protein MotD